MKNKGVDYRHCIFYDFMAYTDYDFNYFMECKRY